MPSNGAKADSPTGTTVYFRRYVASSDGLFVGRPDSPTAKLFRKFPGSTVISELPDDATSFSLFRSSSLTLPLNCFPEELERGRTNCTRGSKSNFIFDWTTVI